MRLIRQHVGEYALNSLRPDESRLLMFRRWFLSLAVAGVFEAISEGVLRINTQTGHGV